MSSTSTTRITGRVKWFNSKAGYGFITACEGELLDKDIFVHFSSIKSDAFHYKYLTQGEYVDFSLTKPENEKHEYHAVDVTGVKGGPILCETRRLNASFTRHASDGEAELPVSDEKVAPVAPTVRKHSPRTTYSASSQQKTSVDTEGFTDVKKRGPPRKKRTSA